LGSAFAGGDLEFVRRKRREAEMLTPSQEAENAHWFGREFVNKSKTIADRLDVPVDWFLAAMSWETGNYSAYKGDGVFANGIHWAENPDPSDAGGGLFGWRHIRARTDLNVKNPVQQLDDAAQYLQGWIKRLHIPGFSRPDDFYVLVRGPAGLTQPDNDDFDMGGGLNQGQVRDIYWKKHLTKLYGWTPDKYPGKEDVPTGLAGQWMVRIGNWIGMFVFNPSGDVWYATMPPAGPLAEVANSARTHGRWVASGTSVRWTFKPADDIRTFEVSLPAPQRKWEGLIRPTGQGSFKMWRGAGEPM
jgi:hypothetical protein